ncbi:MAG: hypothetical protein JW384_02205 [Nitrosomonadaceae bacterium]|nr:hypothetical protein [Nitrosomonadaceae bacterium]
MVMAQLQGKLPTEDWKSSEDLLTNAIFGTLKYLDASITAELLSNVHPLEGSLPPVISGSLDWSFWPWLGTCEPDIVIEDAANICIVEVKLQSGFGDKQLYREWIDGHTLPQSATKRVWVVAVTDDIVMPREILLDQIYVNETSNLSLFDVGWISWTEIGIFIRRLGHREQGLIRAWCADMLELLGRMNIAPFDSFDSRVIRDACSITDLKQIIWSLNLPEYVKIPITRPQLPAQANYPMIGFGASLMVARSWVQEGRISWQLNLQKA